MSEPTKLIYLDYCNGWNETPSILAKCREKKHILKNEQERPHVTKITCEMCGFYYRADSSD